LIDTVWALSLQQSRLPLADELPGDVANAVIQQIGSIRKAIQLAQRVFEPATLTEARQARVEDLTI